MSIGTILLVILILMLIGVFPTWPHSRGWGYGPSGGLGLVLIILLVLMLLGRIQPQTNTIPFALCALQDRANVTPFYYTRHRDWPSSQFWNAVMIPCPCSPVLAESEQEMQDFMAAVGGGNETCNYNYNQRTYQGDQLCAQYFCTFSVFLSPSSF